jgi:ABC-type nitrate/sulfonate/bicarbonate transport system substrate-binding protein
MTFWMSSDNQWHKGRRNVLKLTGTALAGSALAGCTGGDSSSDGDGSSGGGGSTDTSSSGGSSGGGGSTATATDAPASYSAQIPEAHIEMGTIPHLAAVREMMPANTDGRMSGSVRRFENVRLIITALNAGSVDTYTNAPANLYFSQAAGNDYRIVGPKVMGTDYYIVGHEEEAPTLASFIERPDELTFAINQPGNIDHLQVVGVYDQEGLDFTKASTVNVGGSSGRISSFLSGRTQGFTCHIEQFERLQSEGEPVKILARVSEYFPQFVQSCLAVPASKLEDPEFEEFVQAYVTANMQANQRAMNDFDWVFENLQKYQAQPLNREEARGAYDILAGEMEAWATNFPKEPFQSVYDMLRNSGQLERELNIDDIYEPRFAEQAMSQL